MFGIDPGIFLGAAQGIAKSAMPQQGFLDKLFGNKQFLQFLGAAGADLVGNTGGKNILAALTQNIASGNYSKILSHILGGGVPGAKMTADETGVKLNLPAPTGGGGGGGTGTSLEGGTKMQMPSIQDALGGGIANPFATSQLDFSASDLAGVDPEMLTQALGLKLRGDEFGLQKMNSIVDSVYKQALIENYVRQGNLAEARSLIDQQEADTGRMNAWQKWYETATKDSRTELQKNYEAAQGQGFTGKIWEFKAYDETGDWGNYQKSKAEGYKGSFESWLTKHEGNRAIKISTGEKLQEKEAMDKLGARSLFRGDWTKDIDKITLDSDEVWGLGQQYRKGGMSTADADTKALLSTRLGAVRKKIEAAGGQITGRRMDGTTYVYEVKWPAITDSTGKVLMPASTEEIRYANR